MNKLTKILGSIVLVVALVGNLYPVFAAEGGCAQSCQNCDGPYKTMVEEDCPQSQEKKRVCADTYSQQVPYETWYCCQDYETSCDEPN